MWDVAWDLWDQRNHIHHHKENAEVLHNMVKVDSKIQYQF